MDKIEAGRRKIVLGDPVPWFTAPVMSGGSFSLSVAAGRWIVLSFLGSPADPRAERELAEMLEVFNLFHEDQLVFYGVLNAPPADPTPYLNLSTAATSFLVDCDGEISRPFGADIVPRTIILDPMLRAVADIPWDYAEGHGQTVRNVLKGLPGVEDFAGVPLNAPVLIVPRVFDFQLCDVLMQFYRKDRRRGFRLSARCRRQDVADRRLSDQAPQRSRRCAPAIARSDPQPDRSPPVAGRRAFFPVPGHAHGPLYRRLL